MNTVKELTNRNLILSITDSPHSGRAIHMIDGHYIVNQHDFCINRQFEISKTEYYSLKI